ncbi:MAG: response regulator transcription factor [Oscillibacter sp.]|nr:response regulator transcription factor [Oscillibacter sp.]
MRILIVEDEVRLADTLQDLLEIEGYTADTRHDGESGLDEALTGIYDVILLDVMLPRLDGFSVLRRLREAGSAVPVLMLTARSEVSDKVQGLDQGADYYLTKPFEPRELLACVRALARRQPELRNTDMLEFGDLKLEKSAFTLSRGERSVRLSRKEFDMMELLMLNRNLVLTKEKLLLKIWGYESDAEDNNVEVYISFLRKKLDHLHSQVKIKTIRMVGYCLEDSASPEK